MKKLLYLLMVLLLAACGSEKTANISSDTSTSMITSSTTKITAQSVISQMEKGNYKEGELLVKFKSGVAKASSLKVHQAVGASVAKRFHIVPNLEHVKLQEGLSVKDAITQYMSDPNVEYAEPNYIKRALSRIPNDTYFGNQWALHNTGTYAGGTVDADIDAPEAWDISTGSSNIVIAVLDTGIDYSHADLAGNIWTNPGETNCANGGDDDGNGFIDDCRGWNFVDDNNDPMDDFGHGTHVAGIIGADGDNGIGVSGVMWNVRLMPLKVCDASGSCDTADEIAAIDYVVLMKNGGANIKAMNASFGGYGYSQAECDTIAEANTAGILLVAAAGNGGDDGIGDNNDLEPVFPASYGDPKYGGLPNIISVAATDQNDQMASFSNFGPTSVYVAAPGVYILSTILQDEYLDKDFNWGTSMAAPHVSGLAGLLYSYYDGIHNTQFDYSQIRATILRYVDTKPTLEGWIYTGGRINAYRALSSLLSPIGLTATATSQTQISLTWVANATGDDGYKVERKISGGSFTEIGTLPPRSSSYTDGSLTPNTTYTYRVKAYNNISESFFSNEASATTPVIGGSGGGSSSGGGGSCSIGARQNPPTAIADLAVMLIPLIFVAIMRRRR
jgi:subtilisin family serine protease